MARGGARQGVQGQAYSNRTDLLNKPRSQTATPAPTPTGAVPVPANAPALAPPVPLNAPTQRPGEHVMTGTAAGPGPGPMQMGMVPAGGGGDQVHEQLRAIYAAYPNPDLAKLIEALDAGDYASGGLYGRSLI